jgi:DNA topoisomerase-3
MAKLLSTGKTELLDKFISKKGRPFKAFLVLSGGKVSFEFEERTAKTKKAGSKAPKEPAPKIDFTGKPEIGVCPNCGGKIFETEDAYLCEKTQADKKPCKLKIAKTVLQQPVSLEQAQKLLKDGRTDLLSDFVSSKSGRTFKAFLVVAENGKVGWEFPPRE